MSSTVQAVVTHTKAEAEIVLDYDSKNIHGIEDTPTVPDQLFLITEITLPVETANIGDLQWPYYTTLMNGAPINYHGIHSTEIPWPGDDITITLN